MASTQIPGMAIKSTSKHRRMANRQDVTMTVQQIGWMVAWTRDALTRVSWRSGATSLSVERHITTRNGRGPA